MSKPFCCYIEPGQEQGCDKDPDFDVYFGPRPDDYTQGCAEHVGLLIPDGIKEATLVPITLG